MPEQRLHEVNFEDIDNIEEDSKKALTLLIEQKNKQKVFQANTRYKIQVTQPDGKTVDEIIELSNKIVKRWSEKKNKFVYQVIQKKLGEGGFGQVFKSRIIIVPEKDKLISIRKVKRRAVKQELPPLEEKAFFRTYDIDAVMRERSTFEKMHSGTKEPTFDDDSAYTVMPKFKGINIHQFLQSGTILSFGEKINIIDACLKQVEKLHTQVKKVHRDLKPENFVWDNNKKTLKLIDFGLAKDIKEKDNTPVGTPIYQSPEAAKRKGTTTASDVYAMGLIIIEILLPPHQRHLMDASQGKFPGLEKALQNIDVPDDQKTAVQDMLRRMLNPLPEKRSLLDEVLNFFSEDHASSQQQIISVDLKKLSDAVGQAIKFTSERYAELPVTEEEGKGLELLHLGDRLSNINRIIAQKLVPEKEEKITLRDYEYFYQEVFRILHDPLHDQILSQHRHKLTVFFNTITRPLSWLIGSSTGNEMLRKYGFFRTKSIKTIEKSEKIIKEQTEATSFR